MTRERAKELSALHGVISAYAEGKTIQAKFNNRPDSWSNQVMPEFTTVNGTLDYRVAPEPKLRAWNTGEFKSAPPVIRQISSHEYSWYWQVLTVQNDGFFVSDCHGLKTIYWGELFNKFEHSTDAGQSWLPCGIMEDSAQ